MSADKRVKLRGVLDHTASSAEIDAAGDLVVELYDFSTDAHTWLGNDVAFLLRLDAGAKDEALARLHSGETPPGASERDDLILALLQERFSDYYDVRRWLDDQGIPYRKEFEPWA
jgi:hypothetical protein